MSGTGFVTSEKSWFTRSVELFSYLQNYQCFGFKKGILCRIGNGSSLRSFLAPDVWSVKKSDKVKLLKLFSYLQNCQSYGPGSVEKSPKTGILIPNGNGSSPTLTKLDVDIPHESSSNPWNFAPCGSNHNEGEKDCPQCLKLDLSPLEKLFSSTRYTRSINSRHRGRSKKYHNERIIRSD